MRASRFAHRSTQPDSSTTIFSREASQRHPKICVMICAVGQRPLSARKRSRFMHLTNDKHSNNTDNEITISQNNRREIIVECNVVNRAGTIFSSSLFFLSPMDNEFTLLVFIYRTKSLFYEQCRLTLRNASILRVRVRALVVRIR